MSTPSTAATRRAAFVPSWPTKTLVAGVVDGRNVWRTDLEAALEPAGPSARLAAAVAVSTSCSTLHVPYSLAPERIWTTR